MPSDLPEDRGLGPWRPWQSMVRAQVSPSRGSAQQTWSSHGPLRLWRRYTSGPLGTHPPKPQFAALYNGRNNRGRAGREGPDLGHVILKIVL